MLYIYLKKQDPCTQVCLDQGYCQTDVCIHWHSDNRNKYSQLHTWHIISVSHTHLVIVDTHTHTEKNKTITNNNNNNKNPQSPVSIDIYIITWEHDCLNMVMFSVSARLPHPIKMVIAGNHELTFEREHYDYGIHQEFIRKQLGLSLKATDAEVVVACKDLLQHILYLEDEAVNICGIKVYGSPWWVCLLVKLCAVFSVDCWLLHKNSEHVWHQNV